MKMLIENIDMHEAILFEVTHILKDIINKENRNYDDNKRIRNILDDMDGFNITILIEDLDMLKYTMISSIRNISVELVDSPEVEFRALTFPNGPFEEEYTRLINQFYHIKELLVCKYDMDDKLLQYIQPNSRLVNVRLTLSVKELIYFMLTCAKYDELLDINVLLTDVSELMENLVTIAISLSDIIMVDDLFIRTPIEDNVKKNLLESGNVNIEIMSNEDYINHCIENGKADVKMSTIGTCSLVAYREIVTNTPKQSIKIENFYDLIQQEYISLTLPIEYLKIDEYVSNAIDGYLYDWYTLFYNLKEYEEFENEAMLCCLGCFSNIFKMNMMIEEYSKLKYNELSEVEDLMSVLEHKIKN